MLDKLVAKTCRKSCRKQDNGFVIFRYAYCNSDCISKISRSCDNFATTLRQPEKNKRPMILLIYIYIYYTCSSFLLFTGIGLFWLFLTDSCRSLYLPLYGDNYNCYNSKGIR